MSISPLKAGYSGITVRLLLAEPAWVAVPIGNRQILPPDVGIGRMRPVPRGPIQWRSMTTGYGRHHLDNSTLTTSHGHLVKRLLLKP